LKKYGEVLNCKILQEQTMWTHMLFCKDVPLELCHCMGMYLIQPPIKNSMIGIFVAGWSTFRIAQTLGSRPTISRVKGIQLMSGLWAE
jgi:hypothetical protein